MRLICATLHLNMYDTQYRRLLRLIRCMDDDEVMGCSCALPELWLMCGDAAIDAIQWKGMFALIEISVNPMNDLLPHPCYNTP